MGPLGSDQFRDGEGELVTVPVQVCLRRQSTLLAMQMLQGQGYDLGITYHPGKANVVADALSRKTPQEVTLMRLTTQERLRTDLMLSGLEVWIQRESGQLSFLEVQSELMEEIRRAQLVCSEMQSLREQIGHGRPT